MGLIVKKNKDGLYQMISSFDDEKIHKEKWVSEHEAKRVLINRAFWDFFDKMVEIDVDFPLGYYNSNGKVYTGDPKYFDVLHKMRKAKNSNELYEQKYQELKKKYDLDL